MTNKFLGFDIGGTKCMVGLQIESNNNNKDRIFKKYPTGSEFTKDKFIEILNDFSSYCKQNSNVLLKPDLNYIVVSICGLVDNDGIIGLCELSKLSGTNIKQLISAELNISINAIQTVNDGYASLYAAMELYPNETNMGVIVCGTGIGSAFIIDGNILECNDCIAGWIGGCPVTIINNKDNKRETKILDHICGGRAIIESLAPILPEDIVNNSIDDEKDKEKIERVLNDAGYYMGIGICLCLNMMKCKHIVFGGGVFNFPYFYDAMIKSVNENILIKEMADNCNMEICKQYNELVCIGTLILANIHSQNNGIIKPKNISNQVINNNQTIVIIDELLNALTA